MSDVQPLASPRAAGRAFPTGELVRVGERSASYEDVVLASALMGEWNGFRGWTTEALHRQLSQEVDGGALRRAAEGFRRVRHLEAGEDLRKWLSDRAISRTQWESHLRREVTMAGTEVDESSLADVPDDLGEALLVDSYCRRFWETGAHRLVRWMAATQLMADDTTDSSAVAHVDLDDMTLALVQLNRREAGERLTTLANGREALDRAATRVGSESAVEGAIARHWMKWSELTLDICHLASESAAREAMSCAVEDLMTPAEIAHRGHSTVNRQVWEAGDLGEQLTPLLLSSVVDQPVGPFLLSDEWCIAWVREKKAGDTSDPKVRAEVVATLVDEALDGVSRGKTTWRGVA